MATQTETDSAGWLLFHSVGRFPGQVAAMTAEIQDFAQAWCANDDRRWAAADAGRREVFTLWAELIKAPVTSIMAAENVTAAFSAFIEALPAGTLAGRSVLIADDCFPSLHFLLSELGKRIGFTLGTSRRKWRLGSPLGELQMQHAAEIGSPSAVAGSRGSIRYANPLLASKGRETHAGSQGSIDLTFA